MTDVRNVIIIGSGPAGYTAAVYAARANLAPARLRGRRHRRRRADEHHRGRELPRLPRRHHGPGAHGRACARRPSASAPSSSPTTSTERRPRPATSRRVTDGDGQRAPARAVILATGSAYRELGLPSEKRLSGHGVSWCATCDGFFFRDQDIAVVGGGDSALEEATFLTRFADKVTLVHRRDELRASQDHAGPRLRRPQDRVRLEQRGRADSTATTRSPASRCATPSPARSATLDVTGLFVAIGHDPRTELVHGQVDLDDAGLRARRRPVAPRTNLPGVFACGDLVDHTYRQAVTAAGSGCAAALDAEHYLAALEPPPSRRRRGASAPV